MSIINIQIALMLVTNKCLTTSTIGLLWTNNNNLTRTMTSCMLASDFNNRRASHMRLPTISQDHNKMDLKLVGKNILAMVEENEQLTISTFIAFVRQEFGYTITYRKVWLAKQWALEHVYGNWEESYNILPKYLQALQFFIPGTIVEIQTISALDESNQPIPNKVIFHRLFWSFKACIGAFSFCKPIVKINGTWLYGKYKGTIHVIPQHGICLISDRHELIKSAYRRPNSGWTADNSSHVFCIRHIGQNYKKQFKNEDERKKMYAMTQPQFFRHYRELQEDNPHDTTWLDQIPKEVTKLGAKKIQNFPITALVRATYDKLNKYFVDRETQVDAMTASRQVYTLIAAKFIIEEETKSNTHFVQQFDHQRFQFQVEERVNTRERCRMGKFTIRLDRRTLDFGKPQKLHMPCAHVTNACKHINIDYLQYISPVYTLDYVSSVYKVSLAGIPIRRNKKGQPKSTRIRTNMDEREKGQPKRCSIYRLVGHSKNRCPHRPGNVPSTCTTKDLPSNVLRQRSQAVKPLILCEWGYKRILRRYMMNSVITVLYFNGRVYEENDGVIFEGSKKAIQIKRGISFNALKKIGDKVKLQNNEIISAISCRFLVSGKYVTLQICDDEDVKTMLESFQQQNQMSVLELYIEKDVAGASMFHSANFLTSYGNDLSNNEVQPPTNVSNLHGDDDDDYLVSNSYIEESLDEDDSVDGISDTDDEVADNIQPVRIIHPAEGVQGIENPFWNDALHYNNINWSHPDKEDICGLEMPSSFNVGQELYVGMDFDSKDAVKNALKQYVMKVHQTFKVVESKSNKYIVCCLNKSAECPCSFYIRAILSKKTYSWKVTQWGGPHTCLNMTMTQDHEKLDSDLIATCVVDMIREDPSIKVSLIQERINSEFAYKVSYKKAWLAKQKAIALEYGDWEESYAKLSSWLTHMQNHSPGSYFQILHDDFIVGNTVSCEHRQFHRVFWTFGQCKEVFKFCKPIIQVDGTHLYGKYRGTLLMATSQDGNGGVFPLAFVVVEGETLTTWSWFLVHLREHVTDKNGICLISDRHASIKSAVANEALGWQPPHGYHVYCVRHIASNFNRKFNNAKQKEILKKLEKFRQLSPAIATWIDRISKEKWTMAYDREGRRYGHMTTNLSECINKVLKDCRNIPITALVKSTYSRCRKYFVDRGRQAQR
ncbi:hypothetical protein HKD37_14G040806 [Glycine soja]